MDMIYFGMVLQKIEGVYGFTSEFACPVDVTVYADPAAGITEKMFGEAIDAKELIIPAKEGEKVIPMHTVLKKLCGRRTGFARGVCADHVPRCGEARGQVRCQPGEMGGDDEQFPKAVYEMVFPGIEKMPIRNAFPYFKELPFVYGRHRVRGFRPAGYEARDAHPLCEVDVERREAFGTRFSGRKWTLRMADGTFKEADPRLKFTTEGKTVEE